MKMKKLIFFLIIFFLFLFNLIDLVIPVCTPAAPCCCRDSNSGEKRCWNSGFCCKKDTPEEYWDQVGCYDFRVWVEPKSMIFTVGKKTRVNLYIENTAELGYPDSYDIDYIINSDNPALIHVDMSNILYPIELDSGEIKTLYPMITVLSKGGTGNVIFNVTSEGNSEVYRNASLNILQGNLPISLPEFSILNLFVIIVLAGVIFFYNSKH